MRGGAIDAMPEPSMRVELRAPVVVVHRHDEVALGHAGAQARQASESRSTPCRRAPACRRPASGSGSAAAACPSSPSRGSARATRSPSACAAPDWPAARRCRSCCPGMPARSSAGRRRAGWCRSRRRRRRAWSSRCSSGARRRAAAGRPVPSVPTHSGVSFSAHTSAEPKCSMIFGQVFDACAAIEDAGRRARRAPDRDAAATTAALRCRPGTARARRRAAPSESSARCAGPR